MRNIQRFRGGEGGLELGGGLASRDKTRLLVVDTLNILLLPAL